MTRHGIQPIRIGDRLVGPGEPAYVIAELSGNHGGDLDRATELVRIAARSGADAVKIQTYTADTMTIDVDQPWFRIGEGTIWEGRTLHDLYREASTPWEWHADLAAVAAEVGVHLFSTPFDRSAVDHLERQDVPAYKIASFEIVDLPLIRCVAATGRPMIISTGMATSDEISSAVEAARDAGATQLALLRCNSSYPAPPDEMDLRTIPDMASTWSLPIGLSDHTLGAVAAVAALALGACIFEKHLTTSRAEPGPDSAFSLEPDELAEYVRMIREAEAALGEVRYGASAHEKASLAFRRSLFVIADLEAGAVLDDSNVRAIRPANGLPPSALDRVLGRRVQHAVRRGTPLTDDLLTD